MIISFLIAGPIKHKIGSVLDEKTAQITSEISEKLGISITYKSLSPSLLTSFNVKGVKILDENNTIVLNVDNIKITYNIFKLLKKDFSDGIKTVLFDGIDLNINELMNIISLVQTKGSENNISFADIKNNIPKNIKLKNLNFIYNQENVELIYSVKNIIVENKINTQTLDVVVDSVLNAYIPALKRNVHSRLNISGAITDDFENSYLNIKLSDIESGKIKINKLNFHASYINDLVEVHTIQVTNPISLGLSYNIGTNDFSARVNTINIKLKSLFAANSKIANFDKIKNTLISTDSRITCNFNTKKVNFHSKNNINLPESFTPGGMNIKFDFYGDENKVELKEFDVDSQILMANANLTFIYNLFQMEGIIDLPYFVLPNGNSVSTEIYFTPKEKGFEVDAPNLFIGDSSFSGLHLALLPEKDSFDFVFEMKDNSHLEESGAGKITIDGSYLIASKYFQTSLSVNTLRLDSITNAYAEFLPKEKYNQLAGMKSTFTPFVLSGDMYLSTDLKSVSYNVPYVLLANTKKDNQVAMFAINGTEQSIQLNQFSLVYGKLGLQANALFDKNPDTDDIFFDLNITSASVPYHFSGTIMPEICTIMGDYGTTVELRFDKNNNIDGFVEIQGLPFMLGEKSYIISTYSKIKYTKDEGPLVVIDRLEAEGAGANAAMNSRLSMSGRATKYGIQFDSVGYTDFYSALEGRADLMIDMKEGLLESASLGINLQNPLSAEKFAINGSVSNPDNVDFSKEHILNDFYIDLQMQLNSFSLNRFAKVQSDSNNVTGSIFVSGTVLHPYVNANIENFGMMVGASFLQTRGSILLEDRYLSLIDVNINYGNMKFTSLNGSASLDDFSADLNCDFETIMMKKIVKTPLNLQLVNAIVPVGSLFPDTFTATLTAENINGTFIKKEFPMSLTVFHSPEGTNLISSDNIGLSGFLSSEGLFEINWDNKEFMSAKLDGFISKEVFNVQLYDLYMNMEKAFKYVNMDSIIMIDRGSLTGEVVMTGSLSDPELDGHLLIAGPVCKLPFITPQKVSAREIQFNIVDNVISIPDILIKAKSGEEINVGFDIYLNRLSLDYIEGRAKTVGKDLFPGNLIMSYLKIEADVAVDLDMFIQNSIFEITGKVFGENAEISSGLSTVSNVFRPDGEIRPKSKFKYKTDIDVTLGTHSSMSFAPILRCVFVPNTKLNVSVDQTEGDYGIDGEFKLRSGDIAYLGRSFYIKSGAIKFDADDISNPLVTLRAETREHDDRGEPVKIILDVENQHLLDLQPRFRAEPAKSEMEIQSILGQIAVADSKNPADFLFAASDYAFQSTFVRRIENKLRDLLNFDIFSIRTNVLQNTLSMGVSGNLSKENFSIGNFLDNSTVYIGKYLGSSLYLDAMLHISFEDSNFTDITSPGNIIFQPEVGLEMESPFANIRFNLAPDINALIKNNQFVPSTSVTLSWDFTF